ncbi:zinc metalloprotease [Streptomyces sp. NPDC002073]
MVTTSVLVLSGTVLPVGAVGGASAACASAVQAVGRPVSGPLTAAQAAAAQRDFEARKAATPALRERAAAPVVIPVYWHVISKDETVEGGNVSDNAIAKQMSVLNDAFASTGFAFELQATTRTVEAEWYIITRDGSSQNSMKEALRVGGAGALNVYSVGSIMDELGEKEETGYSTFPSSYQSAPKDDGVVISYATMPGGTFAPYNLGHVLTQETGHWGGLYNTASGGCEGPGDYVSDTPDEATPSFGCLEGRDTCAGGGVDPVHNFMDASDDACKNNFTPGQATRVREQLAVYRGI